MARDTFGSVTPQYDELNNRLVNNSYKNISPINFLKPWPDSRDFFQPVGTVSHGEQPANAARCRPLPCTTCVPNLGRNRSGRFLMYKYLNIELLLT